MKICVVKHVPCISFFNQSCPDFKYLGFRIRNGYLEHLVVCNSRRIVVKCMKDCKIAKRLVNRFVFHISYSGGKFIFLFYDRRCPGEVLNKSLVTPTEKEVVALRLFLKMPISGVARAMGISKIGARKLVKKGIEKVVRVL
ncbi:MAG: hypothetical protein QXP31_08715 [Pyrobaculum sp.]